MVVIVVKKKAGKKKRNSIIKNKIIISLMIICFILSSIFSFTLCIFLYPKIEVEKKKIVLEVGDSFLEPKYKAMVKNKDVTNLVKKSGTVDEKKLGTYEINYHIKYAIFQNTEKIIIEVIDKEAPKIELVGTSDMIICPNKEYEEPGFKVTDNYDGDITNNKLNNLSTY